MYRRWFYDWSVVDQYRVYHSKSIMSSTLNYSWIDRRNWVSQRIFLMIEYWPNLRHHRDWRSETHFEFWKKQILLIFKATFSAVFTPIIMERKIQILCWSNAGCRRHLLSAAYLTCICQQLREVGLLFSLILCSELSATEPEVSDGCVVRSGCSLKFCTVLGNSLSEMPQLLLLWELIRFCVSAHKQAKTRETCKKTNKNGYIYIRLAIR